jgi:hypothetical protein
MDSDAVNVELWPWLLDLLTNRLCFRYELPVSLVPTQGAKVSLHQELNAFWILLAIFLLLVSTAFSLLLYKLVLMNDMCI